MHQHLCFTTTNSSKATLLPRVSHNITHFTDAAALQQCGKHNKDEMGGGERSSYTRSHNKRKQWGGAKNPAHTHKQSQQAGVMTRQNKRRKNSSRFWGTGDSRSAGFISVCKPEFPLRFRGPEN